MLGRLAEHHGLTPDDLAATGPIRTERDLVASILGYLARGAGGERRVEDPEVITGLCAQFDGVTSIGGTCVRAATAMRCLGTDSVVHLSFVDDVVRRLLPVGLDYLVSDSAEPNYPHFILQYPTGARIRTDHLDLTASRANRLIYVNDPANERLALVPELAEVVASSTVFLVSGLNAIRSVPELRERLDHVATCVAGARPDGIVVYEDAGYHEPALGEVVRSHMVRLADVYSLSDEELSAALGRDVDLLDPAAVLDAVTTLSARADVPVLVVHSRQWALAVGPAAEAVLPALATGVSLATARYAFGSGASPAAVQQVRDAPVDAATARFVSGLAALAATGRQPVVCVPVPTLEVATPTTVGLGDTFLGGFLAECADSPAIRSAVSRRAVPT